MCLQGEAWPANACPGRVNYVCSDRVSDPELQALSEIAARITTRSTTCRAVRRDQRDQPRTDENREGLEFELNSGERTRIRIQKLVGGPGFEPWASRSRTALSTCPSVSPCIQSLRSSCPFVSSCVLLCPRVRDKSVRRLAFRTALSPEQCSSHQQSGEHTTSLGSLLSPSSAWRRE